MTDPYIGLWVTKTNAGRNTVTRAHLVESEVADEPVTRCGRRLRKGPAVTFLFEPDPADKCYVCKR